MTKLPRCRPAPPCSCSAASSSDGRLAAARRWNPSTDAFELPFHGRANLASERNFQLVTASRSESVAADEGTSSAGTSSRGEGAPSPTGGWPAALKLRLDQLAVSTAALL